LALAPAGAGSRAETLRRRCIDDPVGRKARWAFWLGAALLACAAAQGAHAQFSGTLSGVTDYRYRGVTFSDRRPAAQAGLTYDDSSGLYAGVFGSTVRLDPPGRSNSRFQTIAYGGYAMRLASGVSLEAGGDYSAFAGSSDLNYAEFFVGASTENLNARLYLSPRYFGTTSTGTYGEVNATQPLVDSLRLHLHVGFLRYRYDYPPQYGLSPTKNVFDARIGLRADIDRFQLEIAWVGVNNHSAAYFITGRNTPNGIVAALTFSF